MFLFVSLWFYINTVSQCMTNWVGPYIEMNDELNLTDSFGDETRTCDELTFDCDCNGVWIWEV